MDFHVHAFPDSVAEKAVSALSQAYSMEPVVDGTISGLKQLMDSAGIHRAVVQPVATKPAQVESINNWAASVADDRITAFGSIHPDCPDIAGEIQRITDLGLPGIKIQANWQGVYVDDPKMRPIYDAAQGRLIVLFHAGAELVEFPEIRATPRRIANVIRDFPRLRAVAAHMGGYLMWDEADDCLVGKDIYFDTSACYPHQLPDERFLAMIRNHGAEKVLFATDLPLNDPAAEIYRLANIGLSDEEQRLIFSGNAERLLGVAI